ATADDADPQRAEVPRVLHAVQRVLDDEAAFEGVDDAVVVGAPALALVGAHGRQVLVSGRVAVEHVVPDDAVGGVDAVQLLDVLGLVGVEEAVAKLADLALGHRHAQAAAGARRGNFPESMYSSMRVISPSRQCATTQGNSAVRLPS